MGNLYRAIYAPYVVYWLLGMDMRFVSVLGGEERCYTFPREETVF